jgi:hypothetical protein
LHDSAFRELVWELLAKLKPAACQWYTAAAQHHDDRQRRKQQPQPPQQQPPAAASSDPAVPQKGSVSVPDCSQRSLWRTMAHSIASDLLLVPPGLRDMMGNSWAAEAGRLGGPGLQAASRDSNKAARMLVVQYARAARRQFAQVRRRKEWGCEELWLWLHSSAPLTGRGVCEA